MSFDWKQVKVGDSFCVKENQFVRPGMYGTVIAADMLRDPDMPNADNTGVGLDFFCDVFGDRRGLPSIEFWEWSELELPDNAISNTGGSDAGK